MNHFIIDGRYKDLLACHGLNVQAALKAAGLPENMLDRETPIMKEQEYYNLLEAVDSLSKDPALPIRLSTTNQIEEFSPPIFAAYCSKNGKVCIDRLARYKKLIGPMTFRLSKDGNTETVELTAGDLLLELPTFLVQSEFSFLTGLIRRASNHPDISPVRITMKHLPADGAFSEFTGCIPQQDEKNTITFSLKDLEEPFISASDAMWSYFEPELNKRLADLEVDDSISARVRGALTELLPSGLFSIDDVAEKLGYSRRTLQRRLSEEKTTFQKQLNSTREVLAIHYIQNTDMSTNDIAFLLGYAELNSFLRAFTIWTGKTVTEYRKEARQE